MASSAHYTDADSMTAPGQTLRVGVVLGGFPNLSETFVLDQITGLLDRGHDLTIFAARPLGAPIRHEAVDAYRLLDRTRYYFSGWSTPRELGARSARAFARSPTATAARLFRSLDPRRSRDPLTTLGTWPLAAAMLDGPRFDVVLAHFGTNAALAQEVRDLGVFEAPLVSTFLGKDLSVQIRRAGAGYYRRLFERGEVMLSVSEHYKERLISLGCPADRVRVHRLGVDTQGFRFTERRLDAGQPVRFLSICRLVEKKGLEFGLHAMALLRHDTPAFAWDIAGDGPLRASLEALARQLGLHDRVRFHGPVQRSRARELLSSAHVCLAPSVTATDGDQEGLPVTIIEAMACGLPVVSTMHSGIPEAVRDGTTGYLVPECDPPALANALARIARESDRWPALGRSARAIVEAEFDVHRLNDRLSALLVETAQRHAEGFHPGASDANA
jgi:colanic acid/amylovoran biosynthesis glycosyltransferase